MRQHDQSDTELVWTLRAAWMLGGGEQTRAAEPTAGSSGRSQGRDLPSTVEAPGGWAGSGEGQGCRPPPWGPVSFWKGREPDPVRALGKEGQPSRQVLGPQWAGAVGWPRERGSGGCSLGPRGSWEAAGGLCSVWLRGSRGPVRGLAAAAPRPRARPGHATFLRKGPLAPSASALAGNPGGVGV